MSHFVQFYENVVFLEEHRSGVKKQMLGDTWTCSETFVHTAGPGKPPIAPPTPDLTSYESYWGE